MIVVIPMAGRGSRFVQQGVSRPKPLIEVRGCPMYAWAVDSLPWREAASVVFLCLREHLENGELEADIRARYGMNHPRIVPVSTVTEGQACTVLLARDLIDNDADLLIYNADTYCQCTFDPGHEERADGVLGVFHAAGDQWSFVQADPHGRVLRTAEKIRISEWASTGLYYFRHGSDFVRHADAMINDGERVAGEFYVAPIYNRMIAEGADIRIDVARSVWPLGTPEDLAEFEAHYPR